MIREREPVLDAKEIGIQALTFIASHQDLIDRFVDVTGFAIGDLRRLATQPTFFVAVLDFFLAHEPDVIDLASQLHVRPEAIGRARNMLAKKAGVELIELPG
ncbi:hypothetical protein GCM10011390_03300 [Aureimonas endophytica]|uniref:DUF3572 family protein n=2 Tax=Aureimonas endophytica TaxID=2027858 RepID=A0A917E0H5_9HYPH|nr:hypothetical protein GCM10011390_03300 [Aureimonas endophytica]